ncbi:MAG: DUF2715 domain-containing protein [Candidatus Delongbacteria bacterium]|nr:DUF2715 domain-containing protein [Candidatus Delongbacteria bacterium]
MYLLKYLFLMLLFCLLLLLGQVEEENNSCRKIWFTYNLGISGTEIEKDDWTSGLYYCLGLNVSSRNNNIKIKYTHNMLGGLYTEFSQRVYDFGILYGLKPNFKNGNVIISGGISLVSGYYYKHNYVDSIGYIYEKKSFNSVGIPLELQFDWNTFKKVGIGISIFGNLNFEKLFYGAGLNVNIGSLK